MIWRSDLVKATSVTARIRAASERTRLSPEAVAQIALDRALGDGVVEFITRKMAPRFGDDTAAFVINALVGRAADAL